MDTAVKQSNKENSKPEAGPKKTESRDILSKVKPKRPAPLRSKNEPESKAQVKPQKPAESNNPAQRKMLSEAWRTEQTLRHRKLVLETQKPPSSVLPKPLLPGTYKGRVVKSKIDCFRKPQIGREKNPSDNTTKPEVRSKSNTTQLASSRAGVHHSTSGSSARVNAQKTVSQRRIQSRAPAQTTTKPSTVSTKPSAVSTKPSAVSTKPSAVSTKPSAVSTKPSAVSTKPSAVSTKPSTVSTKPSVIYRKPVTMSARPPTVTSFIKKKEPSKPAAAASEKKPQRSVSSSTSQYRIRVESVEERRLKLADWLTSKGKTLKRPAMTEKSVPQTFKPRPSTEDEAQPETSERAEAAPVEETEQSEVPQRKPAFSCSPSHILNTTLDLLDDSGTEPPAEPEIRMESLVMNLCERLEAMETPSFCRSQTKSEGTEEVKVEEETNEYDILSKEPKTTTSVEKIVDDEEEEKKTMEVKEIFKEDGYEKEMMDSTAADVLDACVVKYNVKTTPFLQSMKKRMESEPAPGSRCKSSIKELKFLTPVRRSSRIHRNSSRLPGMLNEHDPCVSSLAELELLDAADSNAYIYRKNPALLQHLPDQRPEAQCSENTCK